MHEIESSRNINRLLIGKLGFRIGMVGVNYSFGSVTQLSDFCRYICPSSRARLVKR